MLVVVEQSNPFLSDHKFLYLEQRSISRLCDLDDDNNDRRRGIGERGGSIDRIHYSSDDRHSTWIALAPTRILIGRLKSIIVFRKFL